MMFKKVIQKLKAYFTGFFYGMKSVNDTALSQIGTGIEPGLTAIREVEDNRVSRDLLKGEVTQQVEELRYRTYNVDREAKTYEYFSPLKVLKYEGNNSKFVKYENSLSLDVLTVQPNYLNVQSVEDGLRNVSKENENVGDFLVDEKRLIKIERSFNTRFALEKYTTRVVIFNPEEGSSRYVVDFYVSKYPRDRNMKSIYFVREAEKVFAGDVKSDMLSFDRMSFMTLHAYKLPDMVEFRFDKFRFMGTIEYDGHYIFRFTANAYVAGKDHIEDYHSDSMERKYADHERKGVVADLSGGHVKRTYRCEICGKEVVYDTSLVDGMDVKPAREIDGMVEDDGVTEYLDLEMSEQMYGKMLCRDCMRKLTLK
ncbi:MAG: hypothetical protein J6Y37_09335 [Paludibacteraceae bacterium]|nr:hypothetical protein [Paludibacteraceae bacterium]